MRLMHVVVISDNEDVLVAGFFLNEVQAALHAYEILSDGEEIPLGFDPLAWVAQQEGVWITRFVAAHAPTGQAGRRAA